MNLFSLILNIIYIMTSAFCMKETICKNKVIGKYEIAKIVSLCSLVITLVVIPIFDYRC